jgi:HEAT repeat protein
MVMGHSRHLRRGSSLAALSLAAWLCAAGPGSAAPEPAATAESKAATLFKAGDYAGVAALFQSLGPDSQRSKELPRLAVLSYVKLGRPDDALAIYRPLHPAGQPQDPSLLRPIALSVITSRARDQKEHVRIAAYTALAELGLPETAAVLEDGLLDSSVLVRARAAEAIGKAGLAAQSGALRRALNDAMPTVRIAAMNALGEAKAADLKQRFIEIGRTEEGAEAVFAYAALYKMGQSDMLVDITNAATLPDPEVRMAALGVLGRLRRPASLAVLTQAVYDPNPQVRAFAAGALGEFGSPAGIAPLTHAIGDEVAVVRGVAAGSLGRLGIKENRPLLQALTRDPSLQVRASAAEALLRLGDTSAILLAADLARHPDPSIRGAAAQALSAARDKQALSVLQTLLQDQQPLPRLMAAKALGKQPAGAVPLLMKGLQDTDEAVRIAAVGARRPSNTPPITARKTHAEIPRRRVAARRVVRLRLLFRPASRRHPSANGVSPAAVPEGALQKCVGHHHGHRAGPSSAARLGRCQIAARAGQSERV